MGRLGSVKEVGGHSITDLFAQLLPRVCLREDRLRETLGGESTVFLFNDFEHYVAHGTYTRGGHGS